MIGTGVGDQSQVLAALQWSNTVLQLHRRCQGAAEPKWLAAGDSRFRERASTARRPFSLRHCSFHAFVVVARTRYPSSMTALGPVHRALAREVCLVSRPRTQLEAGLLVPAELTLYSLNRLQHNHIPSAHHYQLSPAPSRPPLDALQPRSAQLALPLLTSPASHRPLSIHRHSSSTSEPSPSPRSPLAYACQR